MRVVPAGAGIAAGIAAVACAVLGVRSLGSGPAAGRAIPEVPLRDVVLVATAVAQIDGEVRARRPGRVAALHAAPGDAVDTGDKLIEFEDLALSRSRADLELEIDGLRAAAAPALGDETAEARADARALRHAALRGLEESFEAARRDHERTEALYEGGLLARQEYERKEREFAAVRARLEEARASAERPEAPRDAPAESPESTQLRRAEQLLQRLERLPATFLVRSPWAGTVRALHVRPGEVPARGDGLATLARAALPRMEAPADGLGTVVRVESACGVPGPLPFVVEDGVLSLLAPSPRVRPGDRCEVALRARE